MSRHLQAVLEGGGSPWVLTLTEDAHGEKKVARGFSMQETRPSLRHLNLTASRLHRRVTEINAERPCCTVVSLIACSNVTMPSREDAGNRQGFGGLLILCLYVYRVHTDVSQKAPGVV